MNPTENKDLVRRYVKALDSHDIEAAVALVADDLVNHAAIPEAQGAAGMRRIFGKMLKAFPDQRVSCEDVIAEGDRVACRVSMRGTNTGPIEFVRAPLPATGKPVSSEALHLFRVAGGKIVEHWAGRDDFGMLRQLGHAPFATAVQS